MTTEKKGLIIFGSLALGTIVLYYFIKINKSTAPDIEFNNVMNAEIMKAFNNGDMKYILDTYYKGKGLDSYHQRLINFGVDSLHRQPNNKNLDFTLGDKLAVSYDHLRATLGDNFSFRPSTSGGKVGGTTLTDIISTAAPLLLGLL